MVGNRKPHSGDSAGGSPENVRSAHAQKVEQCRQVSHQRSTILFLATLGSVVTSAGIGDDAIAGFGKGVLLVLPDQAALRGRVAQDQRLSIATRIPITESGTRNRRKAFNDRHGPRDRFWHGACSAVHQHDIEHHEFLARVHPREWIAHGHDDGLRLC